MLRKSWDEYFLDIARVVATRATCPRRSVGCVIVRDRRILVTGYNGARSGEAHCTEVGCKMIDGHCLRAIHAETNAIAQAAMLGVSIAKATAYLTLQPCVRCEMLLNAVGITEIIFAQEFDNR